MQDVNNCVSNESGGQNNQGFAWVSSWCASGYDEKTQCERDIESSSSCSGGGEGGKGGGKTRGGERAASIARALPTMPNPEILEAIIAPC